MPERTSHPSASQPAGDARSEPWSSDREPSDPDVAAGAGWREPNRFPMLLLLGGLVFALALAANFLYLWLQSSGESSVQTFVSEQQPRVQQRARSVVSLLLNYDEANVDKVAEEIFAISTGSFRKQYEQILDRGLQSALEKASASSRGRILTGPDVSFKSASEAVALTRVEQTTRTSKDPKGRSFVYVLAMTLVHSDDGGWKADRVEILSGKTL